MNDRELPTCEGDCEEHHGQILRTHVMDPRDGEDWGDFYYCDEARAIDAGRGFRTKIRIDESHAPQPAPAALSQPSKEQRK